MAHDLRLPSNLLEFEAVGDRNGAAHCLRPLGNISYMRSDYERAQGQLEEAQREFDAAGSRLDAAQCLHSLGIISRMRADYERAQGQLEEAQRESEAVGSRLDVS